MVLIVARFSADELHVTVLVRFSMLPSPYVPMATNCCVAPSVTKGFAGVTAIETRADAVTVSVTNYQFSRFVSFVHLPPVTMPAFPTSMPIESNGCDPEQNVCNP